MKKSKGLLVAMKYILMAIILGGIFGNLVCIMEFLPQITPFANDYIPSIIITSVLSYLSFYFLFMRSRKTIYVLVFIPSEYILGMEMVDFWWKIFRSPTDIKIIYTRAGVLALLLPSICVCIFLIFVAEYIRFRKWLKEGEGKSGETE